MLQVLRSGFYLKRQRPLPYLLNDLYQGPVLILQGVLDPLNAAQDRADLLEQRLNNATKVCIDAGHCPHDEVPELVNEAIDDFVATRVRSWSSESASGSGDNSLLRDSAQLTGAAV